MIESLLKQVPAGRIVAAVRSPEKAADLAARGVVVREADYDRSETLEEAFVGVDKVLLISSNAIGQRFHHHGNVIEAAKKAGVRLIIYTSLLRADTSPLGLAEDHRQTEAAIRASGLPYVILRNGWYTENYEGRVRGAVTQGTLVGCAGRGRVSPATRADYAEAAAAALATEGHEGKVYELGGDEAWTMADLAAGISRQAGREIPYRDVPPEEFAAILVNAGLPEPVAQMLADSEVAIAQDALAEAGRRLSRLIGHPTTPLSAAIAPWVREV